MPYEKLQKNVSTIYNGKGRRRRKKRSLLRDFALAITKAQTSVMIASPATVRTVLAERPDTSYFHVSKTADRAVVMCLSRVRCVISIKS